VPLAKFDEGGSGWPEFAGVLLIAFGIFRFISAIGSFSDSHKIENLNSGLFGNHMWAWGIWELGIAIAAIWAGFALWKGSTTARFVAYLWAVAVIVQAFTIINITPWFAALSIALAVMIVYGLAKAPLEGQTTGGLVE
jgi:hypothetical protein